MNQYRCETCTHNKTQPNTILYRCTVRKNRITLTESVWIDDMGCASHSSYQSERDKLCDYEKDCARSTFATCMECDKNYKNIRKDEREKVLGELERWIPESAATVIDGHIPIIWVDDLKEKLKELRQKAGE